MVSLRRVQPLKRVKGEYIMFVGLMVVFVFVSLLSSLMRVRDPQLHVWFFDVGQGDAIFIETPHGQQILIDSGPDQTVLSKLSSVMWPWDRTIDAIFISHPDADHISGFVSVFEQYDVKSVYETGVRGGTPVIGNLVQVLDQEQAEQFIVRQGDTFEFDGVVVDILWPTQQAVSDQTNRNNTSVVMRVSYGSTTLLLTGDAEAEVELEIAHKTGDIDVLKAGHHGSKTSSSRSFLLATDPEITVISAGSENRYGHPHPIVLSRLEEVESRIFRTDQDGDIKISSDGVSLLVAPAFLPF